MRNARLIRISRPAGILLLLMLVALGALLSSDYAEATHNGKSHGPKKGDGGGAASSSANVELSGGLVTPLGTPQEVVVVRDSKNLLTLEDPGREERIIPTFTIDINLTETAFNADMSTCQGDLPLAQAKQLLVNTFEGQRFFRLQVDKKNLGSESIGKNGHKFGTTWKPDGQMFDLGTRDAIVKLVSPVGVEPRVFEFSGGTVGVRDRSDPDIEPRDAPRLACPNKDTFTVTVCSK